MTLYTKRAIISPLSESDIPEIITMYHEPESSKFIPPLLNRTDDFYWEFLRGKIETNKTDLGFWTVRTNDSKSLIGTVNLNQFKDTDIIHIGAHLSRQFWNQGYAFELLKELINYGFKERNLAFIHGIVSPDHHVSKKLLEKLGIVYYKDFDIDGKIAHLHRLEKIN